MDPLAFADSVEKSEPPAGLSVALQALWWDAKGDWQRAHAVVQEEDDPDSAWVHAYLHRQEGDLANAGYWYRRASKPMFNGPLDDEWAAIVGALLLPKPQ